MNKTEAIIAISTLLSSSSLGSAADTGFFDGKKHVELVELLTQLLDANKGLLGFVKVENRQALNDKGVDVVCEFDGCKIGFQVKSHFDVSQDDFAANVKRQMTESLSHKVAKWFLLICCPMEDAQKNKWEGRISHLLNEFSTFDTDYCCVYEPRSIVSLFKSPVAMPEGEFHLFRRRFTAKAQEVTLEQLQAAIHLNQGNVKRTILPATPQSKGSPAKNGQRFNAVLGMGLSASELASTVEDINKLYSALARCPKLTREYYLRLLQVATYEDGIVPRHAMSCAEAEGHLECSSADLADQMRILEKYGLGCIEMDDGGASVHLSTRFVGWGVPEDIRRFCEKAPESLQRIVCGLEFDLLDG